MADILKENDSFSDDEIFTGKMSLKEIKKSVMSTNRKTESFISESQQIQSFKIIEIHSEPNSSRRSKEVISNTEVKSLSDPNISNNEIASTWDIETSNDTFLKIEKMVSEINLSPDTNGDLNKTSDVVEYILQHLPTSETSEMVAQTPAVGFNDVSCHLIDKNEEIQLETQLTHLKSSSDCTPVKKHENEVFATPSSEMKIKTPLFKTPANPTSSKKSFNSTTKKTPSKGFSYQHIASPVASYIKNCPQATLLKDVHPKKPLPGTSSIPKLIKSSAIQTNKENVRLPHLAYKSAKKTEVVKTPEQKFPQSLAKKLTSSLPKPLVIKHDYRETHSTQKKLVSQLEDSYADLSLHQADVSVCTLQSAYNKTKKQITKS